jgi:hypothetical protein
MKSVSIEEIKLLCQSSFYVGKTDWLHDFCVKKTFNCTESCNEYDHKDKDFNKVRDKIIIHLRNYLQLDNVSFLFGTGSSIHLGAVSIKSIPKQIEQFIKEFSSNENSIIEPLFTELVKKFSKSDHIKRTQGGDIDTPLERFIDYLLGIHFIMENSDTINICPHLNTQEDLKSLELLISLIKRKLFELCDLDSSHDNWYLTIPENIKTKKEIDLLGKFVYHKRFVKSLLQRPLNLRRANIFTTNYDLAFEHAFDELGVHYIDGFSGFHNRTFRPEIFDYDIYYPGTTTEGKVRRIERVLRYFKLHGSITWIKESPSSYNIYGLSEKPREQIKQNSDIAGNMVIYPNSCKKGYTLDFPYSELFRQFAATITQPQSVLFCIGYSFFDEHINDIIQQALSVPSFTLVIVDFNGTKNEEIKKLKDLDDPRILVLEGPYLGDFKVFSTDIIPNLYDIDVREKVASTMNKLYPKDNVNDIQGDILS